MFCLQARPATRCTSTCLTDPWRRCCPTCLGGLSRTKEYSKWTRKRRWWPQSCGDVWRHSTGSTGHLLWMPIETRLNEWFVILTPSSGCGLDWHTRFTYALPENVPTHATRIVAQTSSVVLWLLLYKLLTLLNMTTVNGNLISWM